ARFSRARRRRIDLRFRGGIRSRIHFGQCLRHAMLLGLQVRHLVIVTPSYEIVMVHLAVIAIASAIQTTGLRYWSSRGRRYRKLQVTVFALVPETNIGIEVRG